MGSGELFTIITSLLYRPTIYIYRLRYNKNYQDIEATLDWTYYEDAGRKPSEETYFTKTRGK